MNQDEKVQAWLKSHAFNRNNLRQEATVAGLQLSALQAACLKGQRWVCEWLYDHDADTGDLLARTSCNGDTPMHLACQGGHLSVCRWLLEKGSIQSVSTPDEDGSTPMLAACYDGHLDLCKWLYAHGAAGDVRKSNKLGSTPMLWACRSGHLPVCQWLFDVGAAADITKANKSGVTPMAIACTQGHWRICCWLVLNGAFDCEVSAPLPTTTTMQAAEQHSSPSSSSADAGDPAAADAESRDAARGAVGPRATRDAMLKVVRDQECAVSLVAMVHGYLALHDAFFDGFLPGTLSSRRDKPPLPPSSSPESGCVLWMLSCQGREFSRLIKTRIGAFLGLELRAVKRLRALQRARDVLRALRSDDGDYDDESGGGGGGDDGTRGREVVLVDSEI